MPDDAIERARKCLIREGMHEDMDAAISLVPYAVVVRAMLAFASQQAPEGWRPIDTAPDDEPFIVGLWVTNNQTGARWWEWYIVAIDDESGEARSHPGDEALPWRLSDFEAWHSVPAPPAMLDAAPSVTSPSANQSR